jgi:hypothetical protein
VPRALLALLVVFLAPGSPLVFGASGAGPAGGSQVATGAAAKITLQGSRLQRGPWRRSLSLQLVKGFKPISFYVCAVWGEGTPQQPCRAAAGSKLPAGATMRLEQRPIGPAVRRPDSPGWGMVGLSSGALLEAVLSNNVSGNRLGTVTYRVTLRNESGRVLATSNMFKVAWHK